MRLRLSLGGIWPQSRDRADVPFPLPATVECLVYSVFEASEV